MNATQIRQTVTSKGSALNLAAELYPLEARCEGTPEQCFLAGLWNACTMQEEEGLIATDDDETFLKFCFCELDNMYPQ